MTAPLVTVLAVGLGLLTHGSGSSEVGNSSASADLGAAAARPGAGTLPQAAAPRTLGTSRSAERVPLVDNRVPRTKRKLWITSDLNVRVAPRKQAAAVGLLDAGTKVPVTGLRRAGYAQVVVKGVARWVTADYLSKVKAPEAAAGGDQTPGTAGLSDQPCPDGSSIESALQPASVRVYRAACAAFPELSTYGGQDGHGEHVNGQAIDFMVSSSSLGQRLADFLYAHHAELDLFDIIWSQHIWTIQRSGEGFRSMSDRGSATANHYDHVHIMVN